MRFATLARDAQSHAERTGSAYRDADGLIRTKRRKLLALSWESYGIYCLKNRLLTEQRIGGRVRYLPPKA